MKFILDNGVLGEVVQEDTGALMGMFNKFSDFIIDKEVEFIVSPLLNFIQDMFISLGQWIILNLPDIVGYATIGAGAFIILSSMTGKGNMFKTIGWYFGFFVLAVCILGGV